MRSLPPYALAAPEFRFRAVAALAGRAAIGGARELVLAVLLGARLVDGAVGDAPIAAPMRRVRATSARTWLAALALPPTARSTLGRLIEATAGEDRAVLRDAWDAVVTLAAPSLDVAARAELRRLSAAIAAHPA
jgi:hypothetical protein